MNCDAFRDQAVHVLLGEADAALARAWRAHAAQCVACARESAAVEQLLTRVRTIDAPATSTSFKARTMARLTSEHSAEESEYLATAGLGMRARATVAFVRHRVSSSFGLRILLAVAAIHVFALTGFLIWTSATSAPSRDRGVAQPPGSESSTPADADAVVQLEPVEPVEPGDELAADPFDSTPFSPSIDTDLMDLEDLGEVVVVEPPDRLIPPELREPLPPLSPGDLEEAREATDRNNRLELERYMRAERFTAPRRTPRELAIHKGLKWLASLQESDGSFDPTPHGGGAEARVGMTALAMSAFLVNADKGVPGGLFRQHVRKGFDYLRQSRDDSNTFGNVRGAADVTLFNHALATYAFTENYILTGGDDAKLLSDAVLRLDDLSQLRAKRDRRPADDTTAPWVALALARAQSAGVSAPVDLADSVAVAKSFVATLVEPRQVSAAAIVVNMLPPQTLDRPPIDVLLDRARAPDRREPTLIYFATVDFHQRGGSDWNRWNDTLAPILLDTQDSGGAWVAAFNWGPISRSGGDVYETALHILSLSEETIRR